MKAKSNSHLRAPINIRSFGDSMSPLLQNNDVVSIKKVSFDKIKVNDIVCIKQGRKFATHRVVFKGNNHVITKGDNNLRSDGRITSDRIIGKITNFTRDGKKYNLEDLYLLQSSIYFEEITKVKNALKLAKVDYVILKGLPLYLYYYNTHPRRIYADCDLLISKPHMKKAIKILARLGYQTKKEDIFFKIYKHKVNQSEIEIFRLKDGLNIELDVHFEVVFTTLVSGNPYAFYPQKSIDKFTKKLLLEKQEIKLDNETFPVLSPENLFVYIAMHAFHHKFKPIHRYDLISELTKKKINYDKVAQTIKEFELENFLYPCFSLYNKHFKKSIPFEFLKSIRPKDHILTYTQKNILPLNIFDEQITDKTKKTEYLFNLSPLPLYRKLSFLIDPWVYFYASFITLIRLVNSTRLKQ